ncbi:hypothetical protein [Actinoplanes sp. GCM10030250]|uniref:hypothetical protein n=1 Tax=Actinoplanes sp. GCM10030250 TaxID=3273376 RepID=UPI00360DC39C
MTPFDDPFDLGPDAGGSSGSAGPGPVEPVPARTLCRMRGVGARARTRYRGGPPR